MDIVRVLIRSVRPGTLSLETWKFQVARLAADETLRCRDPRTGQELVPRQVMSSYGGLPRLEQDVEIELRSLQQHLLHLHAKERWSSSLDDILNLGNAGVDPEEVLQRRLVASASAAPETERADGAGGMEKTAARKGRKVKEQIPPVMALVGIKLAYEGEVMQAVVEKWIMDEMEKRGDRVTESTARRYAAMALGEFRAWQASEAEK